MIRLRDFSNDQLDNASTTARALAIGIFAAALFKDAGVVLWALILAFSGACAFFSHYVLYFKRG